MGFETVLLHWDLHIKIHWSLTCTLSGCFIHIRFWIIMHWPFGKYLFTKLCRPSKCWHISLYKTKKSHLLISPWILSANSLSIGNCLVAEMFFKILIFAWNWNLSATNTASYFPWVYFSHFWETVCHIPKCEQP